MITRGLFIKSISELDITEEGYITATFEGTELTKTNINDVFKYCGRSPYNLATLLPNMKFERFKEPVDYFYIAEGKSTDPIMFTIHTDSTSLTFGKAWFRDDSPISYEDTVTFIQHVSKKYNIKVMLDGINYLAYGE
jgi:hypothetical protein